MIVMIMNDIYSYRTLEPKRSQEFLIDNSVLLYPFAPIGNYNIKLQSSISRFFQICKTVNSGVHTTSLVISEFYNKVLKDFFEDYKLQKENAGKTSLKNDYRKCEHFKDDIDAINGAVKSILKVCTRFSDDFNSINIDHILNNTMTTDFNDAYFIELANQKNWIIVTRDKDIINNPFRKTPVLSFLD